MSFLDKLWDETLASPAPETGQGKLRKYNSFSGSTRFPTTTLPVVEEEEEVSITRSITILRTNSTFLSSSAFPSTPLTPETALNLRRRKWSADAVAAKRAQPRGDQ